jgi:hypothetical protein
VLVPAINFVPPHIVTPSSKYGVLEYDGLPVKCTVLSSAAIYFNVRWLVDNGLYDELGVWCGASEPTVALAEAIQTNSVRPQQT